MSTQTLLAVPLTSSTPPLAEQVRAARAAGADVVELRVDCFEDVAAVEALLVGPRELPLIVTVRSAEEGGAWTGSEADRIALLERLGLLNPGFIDLEYAAWCRSANIRQKIGLVCALGRGNGSSVRPAAPEQRPRNQLILSYHDFSGAPADLTRVFDELLATPAGIIKVAVTAEDALDACRVLAELASRRTTRKIIALAMGPAGVATRVLARKFGAFLTFAALSPGAESAPGQPTVSELKQVYGWEAITADCQVYGVIGWPVAHSRSPHVHNAAMRADGIAGVYVPWAVQPGYAAFAAFMDYVTGHPELDIAGLSVTVPHKENARRWVEERGGHLTERARHCGAVNTLTRRGARWWGDNTDGVGAVAALETSARIRARGWRGLRVAVLGAGGAARALVAALRERNCEVTVFNRTADRARRLARELGCDWGPWNARGAWEGEVVVNCTTVGMAPAVEESPLSGSALRPEMIVLDTVYSPPDTRLLREARVRGCEVISGEELFLEQAAAQYELWHGRRPPPDVMRRALSRV